MNEGTIIEKLELIKPELRPQLQPIADSILDSYKEVGSVSNYSMDMAVTLIGEVR